MKTIAEYVQFLNDIREYQARQYRSKKDSYPPAALKHKATADGLAEVINFLESSTDDGNVTDTTSATDDLFSVSESDYAILPEGVRGALNLSDSDRLERQIIELLNIAGRPLSTKELIIGLFKKDGVQITERNKFSSKLSRMCRSSLIKISEGKRGVYEVF